MPLPVRLAYVVDQYGFMLQDPATQTVVVGAPPDFLDRVRLVYALPLNQQGGINLRYRPPHPPGEDCEFGISFDYILPRIVDIVSGALTISTNTVPPQVSTDWTIGDVEVRGRALYATLTGGVDGSDYQLAWVAVDTDGNAWPRTALCLCASTS